MVRQGESSGKQNIQLELSRSILPVNIVLIKMLEHLESCCRLHVGHKKWKNHVKKLDMIMSNSDTTRVIFTDFGVTLDLKATETDNSSLDNHVVICIFFVLTNCHPVDFYNSSKKSMDETIINDCDKWIVFGDTLSRGVNRSRLPQCMLVSPY